jgi:hypothetical protein
MEGVEARAKVFGRGSVVREYWLVHAEGFAVGSRPRPRERVERVLVDPLRGRATGLVLRSRRPWRRQRLLAADAVVAVDPFARVLRLEGAQPRRSEFARSAAARSAAMVAWLAPRVRQQAQALHEYGKRFVVWSDARAAELYPVLLAAARATRRAAARLTESARS